MSFQPIPKFGFFSVQAGPQYSILLKQDEHLAGATKDAFRKGDLSLVGGVQLDLGRFLLGARYVIGVRDLDNISDNNNRNLDTEIDWKGIGWQAYMGFRLF